MAKDFQKQNTETEAPQRIPPNSIGAEACVLGSMILDSNCIDIVVQMLEQDHFYRPAHQIIYSVLTEMKDAQNPIDLVTVKEEMLKRKQLDVIGGVEYLADLVSGVPNAASAEYYSTLVRDKALLRKLISAGSEIINEAYDAQEDAANIVERAESSIFQISSDRLGGATKTMEDLINHTFEVLQNQDGEMITGVSTGYNQLNELTGGFQPSEMVIVAARPSMGKTSLLLNLVEHISIIDRVPVAIFSLEMSQESLAMRLLASYARFDLKQMRRGMISPEDWTQLQQAAADMTHAPIFIDDSPELTVSQMRAKCRRLKSAHNIQAVMIDYLQLLSYHGRADSRQVQVSEMSRGLKALARELEVPVIVAAQLNRGPADRPTHTPRMSDLRESGSIEQDADVITLLHNEDYYHRGEVDYTATNVTQLIVAKQRNGPTGIVDLVFRPEITRFEAAAAVGSY